MNEIKLGGDHLKLSSLIEIARNKARVHLAGEARERINKSRALIETWVAEGRAVYGVTTGFGALCDVTISREETRRLQENIIMSHSAGVGEPLAEEIVRATMAIRIQDLAKGYAGIRLETLETMVALLNSGICPVMPEKGSVGASGDLAPMSHLALVMIGQGEAFYLGRRMDGGRALAKAGIPPVILEAGEGLALVNGTQVMTAIAALAVYDAEITEQNRGYRLRHQPRGAHGHQRRIRSAHPPHPASPRPDRGGGQHGTSHP